MTILEERKERSSRILANLFFLSFSLRNLCVLCLSALNGLC